MRIVSGAQSQPVLVCPSKTTENLPPKEPMLHLIKHPPLVPPPLLLSLPSSQDLHPLPRILAAWADTCQMCFFRYGGGPGAMKPVRVVTLCWVLLLASRLGATRKESPEEASFYYGNFPLGMSTLQLLCLSVHLSVSLPTLADLSRSFGVSASL